MKIRFALLLLTLLVVAAAPVSGEEMNLAEQATGIIELRCTRCHTDARIQAAVTAGKEMNNIVEQMQKHGAQLSAHEEEVLGIFWKKKKAPAR